MPRSSAAPYLLGGGALALLFLFAANTDAGRRAGDAVEHLIEDWMKTLLRKTSQHEGTFWSVQRNLDGNGVSYGIIQVTQKAGSLGRLLAAMYARDAAAFMRIFGPSWAKVLAVTGRASMEPVDGYELWRGDWPDRFAEAGRHVPFQETQLQYAMDSEYMSGAIAIAKTLGVQTERAMVLFYNRTVHQGPGTALKRARQLLAHYAAHPGARPANPNDVLAQYAWLCADAFRTTTAPARRNYNDAGNIWWEPVAEEWSELAVGRYAIRRVAVSGVWHAVTSWGRSHLSLYDLVVRRSSDILLDPELRDHPVRLP